MRASVISTLIADCRRQLVISTVKRTWSSTSTGLRRHSGESYKNVASSKESTSSSHALNDFNSGGSTIERLDPFWSTTSNSVLHIGPIPAHATDEDINSFLDALPGYLVCGHHRDGLIVQFDTPESCRRARAKLHYSVAFGNQIECIHSIVPPFYYDRSVKRPDVGTHSIFVNFLPKSASREDIVEAFQQFGTITDVETISKSFAQSTLITFSEYSSADRAVLQNYSLKVMGRKVKIMYSNRSIRRAKSYAISNVDTDPACKYELSVTNIRYFTACKELETLVLALPGFTSYWVPRLMRPGVPIAGRMLVYFDSDENRKISKRILNHMILHGRQLVAIEGRSVRPGYPTQIKVKRVHTNSLPSWISKERLLSIFSQFGEVENITMPFDMGFARGHAWITFKDQGSADRAVQEDFKLIIDSRRIRIFYGGAFMQHDQDSVPSVESGPCVDYQLVVFGIKDDVCDFDLENLLSPFQGYRGHYRPGRKDHRGLLYGDFFFASFDTEENRQEAAHELDRMLFKGNSLYIKIAQTQCPAGTYIKFRRPASGTCGVYIPNIPTGATEREVADAFAIFGKVKNVKVLGFYNPSRTVAIVDFESTESAELAVQASRRVAIRKRLVSVYYSTACQSIPLSNQKDAGTEVGTLESENTKIESNVDPGALVC